MTDESSTRAGARVEPHLPDAWRDDRDADRLTRLAMDLCGASAAWMVAEEAGIRWLVSWAGKEPSGALPDLDAFRGGADANGWVVISDLAREEGVGGRASLSSLAGFGFLAAVFLRRGDGSPLGALLVLDPAVRSLSESQRRMLEDLGRVAEGHLERAETAGLSVDGTGVVTGWNGAATRLLGWSSKEAIGREVGAIVRAAGATGEEVRAALTAVRSGTWKVKLQRKDGSCFSASIGPCPLWEVEGHATGSRVWIRDDSAQRPAGLPSNASERRLRHLLDATSDLIQEVGPDGRILFVNRAWCEVLGYDDPVGEGLRVFDLIHPDHQPHCEALFGRLMSGMEDAPVEAVLLTRSGRAVIVEGRLTVCRDEEGPTCICCVFRNITRHREIERELQEFNLRLERMVEQRTEQWKASERRFREVVESIDEVFWMATAAIDRILYVSPAYERVWGRSCGSLYENPRSFLEAIHAEDVARVLEGMEVKAAGGAFAHEYRIRRPDGSIRWIHDRGFPIRNPDGTISHYAGVSQDITERVRAMSALESGQAFLQAVESSLPTGIATVDLDGRQTYVNPAFCAMVGWSAEELLGQLPPFSYWAPEARPRINGAFVAMFEGGGEVGGEELTFLRRDGTSFPVLVFRSPLIENGRVTGWLASVVDLSEQKRAQEALRKSELSLKKAQRVASVGSWELDLVTGRLDWSDEVFRMFEVDPATFPHSEPAFLRLVHPEDRAAIDRAFSEAVAGGRTYGVDHRVVLPGGRIKVVWEQCEIEFDSSGRAVRAVGTVQDVTARKRAEEELRISRARLSYALQGANDGLWDWDLATNEVFFSPRWMEMIGYGPDELPAHFETWEKLLHPEDQAGVGAALTAYLEGRSPRYEVEFRLRHKDGHWVYILSRGRFAAEPGGDPRKTRRMVGTHVDISLRKEAEEALRASEERFRQLFVNAPFGIALLDPAGRHIQTNPNYRSLLGFSEDVLRRRSYFEFPVAADHPGVFSRLASLRQGRCDSFEVEIRLLQAGGGVLWVRSALAAERSPEGGVTFLIVMIEDISDRRRLEAEILDISSREQQRIGHDLHDGLGQHLAGVAMRARLLEDSLRRDGSARASEAEELVSLMNQSVRRAREMARGLDPIDAAAGELVTALKRLAAEAEDLFGVECSVESTILEKAVPRDVSLHLYRITQEAINNAARHGHAKRVRVRLCGEEGRLTLVIHDDGIGLDPVAAADRRGMGMHIMRYRASALGGALSIRYGANGGTDVVCEVPIADGAGSGGGRCGAEPTADRTVPPGGHGEEVEASATPPTDGVSAGVKPGNQPKTIS